MPVAMSSMRSSPGAMRLGEECLMGPEGPEGSSLPGASKVEVDRGTLGTRRGWAGAEGRKEERMWWRLWTVAVREGAMNMVKVVDGGSKGGVLDLGREK